jgi:hypothetical protein
MTMMKAMVSQIRSVGMAEIIADLTHRYSITVG